LIEIRPMEDYYFVTDACSTTLLLPNQTP